LDSDSPDLEIGDGVHARIVMTSAVMVSKVTMAARANQQERSHHGETLVLVLTGSAHITIGGEAKMLNADEVAIVPPGERYSLAAGDAGCTRLDVFTPPDMTLAEEAFHQEHANHGFE